MSDVLLFFPVSGRDQASVADAGDKVVYLASQTTKEFQSFSSPLTNIHDSHVSAPFFGPNVWTALIQPVSGGGIPPSLQAVQVKVTFKEGGAFDFQNNLERIKERLQDAMEVSPDTARGLQNVNLSGVHLEELPAYEGPPGSSNNTTGTTSATSIQEQGPSSSTSRTASTSQDSPYSGPEPNEPPPGYEEVQQQSVANELEETLRRAS